MNHQSNKSGRFTPITLPYDFIPFAESGNEACRYPYTTESVPKHNDIGLLSGQIRYRITPCSDLAIEARSKLGGGYFISGSQIRGKVRANVSILSASDPKFIDRSPILYRDFTKKSYTNKILTNSTLERSIHTGFLRKKGDKFYLFPAKDLGDKKFIMLKEHWVIQQNAGLKYNQQLFRWNDGSTLKDIQNREDEIKQWTGAISAMKEQLGGKYDKVKGQVEEIFLKYGFTKRAEIFKEKAEAAFMEKLEAVIEEIKGKLEKQASDPELRKLFALMVERWGKKAHIHRIYFNQKTNTHYTPYQQNVYFRLNAYGGVEHVSVSSQNAEKGYLYNSTNARTKRSHYLIGAPKADHPGYELKQAIIDGYNRNLKKFGITENKSNEEEIKLFYNIFSEYEKCLDKFGSVDGLVVFYQTMEESSEQPVVVGRTPYFKVPYYYQLNDLLGTPPADKVDYEDALFGFAPEGTNQAKEAAYKSRVRFEPIDIPEDSDWDCTDFLLQTPQASAERMYLKPNRRQPDTYEDLGQPKPKLNGYKYYHVLEKPLEKTEPANLKNRHSMLSQRALLKKLNKAGKPYTLSGTVSFTNLRSEELGLLLLGLDIKLLKHSRSFKEELKPYCSQMGQVYELVGGAKPYGYGKVKIDVDSITFEKQEADFDSLILSPEETVEGQENFHSYVDAFIARMNATAHFQQMNLDAYIRSKMEFVPNNPKFHINWSNMQEKMETMGVRKKGGGYPKDWMLNSINHDGSFKMKRP